MTTPQNPRVTQADEEWAEEVASAANIVTNGGYYEIDIDAVTLVIARHREAAEAASKEREAALVEALTVAARTMEAAEERMGKFARANIGIIGGACPRYGAQELRQGVKAVLAALTKEPDA